MLVDLCQTESLDVPHLVYSSDLSNLIFGQMGEYLSYELCVNICLDALRTHVFSPTEFYLEPLDFSGNLKVMLILTPILSKFIIPYFNSPIYREHLE